VWEDGIQPQQPRILCFFNGRLCERTSRTDSLQPDRPEELSCRDSESYRARQAKAVMFAALDRGATHSLTSPGYRSAEVVRQLTFVAWPLGSYFHYIYIYIHTYIYVHLGICVESLPRGSLVIEEIHTIPENQRPNKIRNTHRIIQCPSRSKSQPTVPDPGAG
jgi:hypothetical protein